MTLGVVRALGAVHAAGYLHLDTKPDNLVLDGENRAILIDFGLVQRLGPAGAVLPAHVSGTLAYMAPERFKGWPLTPATDLYGAAALLHALLSGAAPLAGLSLLRVLKA